MEEVRQAAKKREIEWKEIRRRIDNDGGRCGEGNKDRNSNTTPLSLTNC